MKDIFPANPGKLAYSVPLVASSIQGDDLPVHHEQPEGGEEPLRKHPFNTSS
jgi:hypothetical protein